MKTVFRVQPVERGGVKGIAGHNSRMPGHESEHIDPERTHLNFYLRGDNQIEAALRDAIQGVPMARGCKDKSKENVACEMVMSASPEFFESGGDVQAWAKKSLEWIDREFPGRCISFTVHMDEETPHAHAVLKVDVEKARINPVTKELMQSKKVLSYSDNFVDRKEILTKARIEGRSHIDTKLGRLQTSYAEAMAPFGLKRGECSMRTKREDRKHITPAEYREREKALVEHSAALEQANKAKADLVAIQKAVVAAKGQKTALETEAAVLAQKIKERQEEEKGAKAAVEARMSELVAVEKQMVEKTALVAHFEKKAAEVVAVSKSQVAVQQDELAMLKADGEKARAAFDILRADISKMEIRADVLRDEVATLERKIPETTAALSKAGTLRDGMLAEYEKAKGAAEAWAKEAEKLKIVVVEKTSLPIWSLLCKQSGDPKATADFVKALPETVARAIAKTAPEETQQKLIQQIRSVHARSHGMSMGR